MGKGLSFEPNLKPDHPDPRICIPEELKLERKACFQGSSTNESTVKSSFKSWFRKVKDWKELRFPKIGRSGRLAPDNQKLFTERPIERSVAGGLTEASSVKIN
jgi:hypothetical protein